MFGDWSADRHPPWLWALYVAFFATLLGVGTAEAIPTAWQVFAFAVLALSTLFGGVQFVRSLRARHH